MWMKFVFTLVTLFFVSRAAFASQFPDAHPPIPAGATSVGTHRFVTKSAFSDVVDWYARKFRRTGGIRWFTVINQPGVRAKHIKSLRAKSKWEGLNIGEYDGRVHIFVLMREPL